MYNGAIVKKTGLFLNISLFCMRKETIIKEYKEHKNKQNFYKKYFITSAPLSLSEWSFTICLTPYNRK